MFTKFPLGRIVGTPGALNAIPPDEILEALSRHMIGDWGALGEKDKAANARALTCGERLLSFYQSFLGVTFWIITERDRSATTVLPP